MTLSTQNKKKTSVFFLALFAMYGALMFVSKWVMEFLPNMHLIGVFVVLFTIVYRRKALIPIYVFVFITGFFYGFNIWWVPYLYIWTLLWGVTMLLPRNMNARTACMVYPVVCALHGLLYGTLYAPAQAVMFGLDLRGMIAWIIAGLPFDAIHAAGNFAVGFLIEPLSRLITRLEKRSAT